MSELTITIPETTLLALHATPEEAGARLRLAAAMKLYEIGQLSSGVAAQLAGIPRTLFLTMLADHGLATFDQSEDELQQELSVAERYF
jgi:predicted HTH domain antitoxin